MAITLYKTATCTLCPMVIRAMDKAVPGGYTVVSVEEDAEAREFVMGTLGYLEAPVTVVTDEDGEVVEHWGKFSPDRIRRYAPANA